MCFWPFLLLGDFIGNIFYFYVSYRYPDILRYRTTSLGLYNRIGEVIKEIMIEIQWFLLGIFKSYLSHKSTTKYSRYAPAIEALINTIYYTNIESYSDWNSSILYNLYFYLVISLLKHADASMIHGWFELQIKRSRSQDSNSLDAFVYN